MKFFVYYAVLDWLLVGLLVIYSSASHVCTRSISEPMVCKATARNCNEVFQYSKSHPVLRERKRLLVLTASDSIARLFVSTSSALSFAIQNDLALLLTINAESETFAKMLEPNVIDYVFSSDDELPVDSAATHVLRLRDGFLSIPKTDMSQEEFDGLYRKPALEVTHIRQLTDKLLQQEHRYRSEVPCVWQFLFRMTPVAYNRFRDTKSRFVLSEGYQVWHIPTNSRDDTKHPNKFDEDRQSNICKIYFDMYSQNKGPQIPIYISTTSPIVRNGCQEVLRLHNSTLNVHYSPIGSSEESLLSTYLEFFVLTRATELLTTTSTYSVAAAAMGFMHCKILNSNANNGIGEVPAFVFCRSPVDASTNTQISRGALLPLSRYSAVDSSVHKIDTKLYGKQNIVYPVPLMEQSCGEFLWCNGSTAVQDVIYRHQNPESCHDKKFLFFDPHNSNGFGIGAMIHIAANALQLAMCTGRILYFPLTNPNPKMQKIFRPPGCKSATMPCYFMPVTHCKINEKNFKKFPVLNHETYMDSKVIEARIVKTLGEDFPRGPCSFCNAPAGFPFPDSVKNIKDAFIGAEAPLMAQTTRYLIRPQPWFLDRIAKFTQEHFPFEYLPRPFASMHVRYGDKLIEAPRQPLSLYMDLLQHSRPDIRHILLSTETESVITTLRQRYPSFQFYSFNYSRIEANGTGTFDASIAVKEFVASFANLYIAVNADAFVGSLSSNWCRLIHELERTRGDGGSQYISVDGSQYNRCFGRR